MSTIFEFVKKNRTRGVFWWLKYYWNELLTSIYQRKVSNKIDNSWKGIKIAKTIIPKGWTKENAFEFLGKEWSKEHKHMKAYKD